MAVIWAFRLAIWAATTLTAVRIAQGLGAPSNLDWGRTIFDILRDPSKSDAEKSAEISALVGYPVDVATFPGPFSLRKLHVIWSRGSGSVLPEDDAICTFHFLKLVSGEPDDNWTDANFLRVEQLWDAAWGALQGRYSSAVTLREYRWYEAGPDIEAVLGQGRTGPPRRVVARSSAGSSSSVVAAPPQVAVSVTEKTTDSKSWGRFYLPNPAATTDTLTVGGRFIPAFQVLVATAFEGMYDTLAQEGLPVVVYSRAKSERQNAAGGTLPAIGARALTVNSLQVDDIADVIRSRRYNSPLLREIRTIG